MVFPKVYADFHNADAKGRLRLNCLGTMQDLARHRIQLRTGLALTLYSDDADANGRPTELQAKGIVDYSEQEQCWVAAINWGRLRHVPELAGGKNGVKVDGKLPKRTRRRDKGKPSLRNNKSKHGNKGKSKIRLKKKKSTR